MLSEYIMLGFTIAITVAAMLLGFVALITAINSLFDSMFGITFQAILGYIFSPLAFVMGIPQAEMVTAGQIMATKLVSNEFVAMLDLGKVAGDLSARTVGILSVFLVSFANSHQSELSQVQRKVSMKINQMLYHHSVYALCTVRH